MSKTSNTYPPALIFKYIGKKFTKTIILTSIVLALVWMLADSIELSRRLSSKDVSDFIVLELLSFKAAGIYLEILPFAVLIGSLICFSALAKSNELIAIRASGVSVWQFLKPACVLAFVFGVVGTCLINPIASVTQKKYETLEQKIFPGKARGVIVDGQQLWLRYDDEDKAFVMHANHVSKKGVELQDVSVYIYDTEDSFIKRVDSKKAMLVQDENDHYWHMQDAVELVPQMAKKRIDEIKIPTQMTPEKILFSFSSPKTISIFELPEFISSLESAGFSTLRYQVILLNNIFLPLLCVAMFILAAPFALHFSRRGGIGKLLLSGLCFGFIFYMFNSIITTLAQAGRLNIYIAVVIPILIAGLVGVYMLLHFREE
jgi:lipopolysaccharide export system permease protein